MARCASSSPPPSWRRWRPSAGLAQAAAGLVAELRRLGRPGVDVDVVMPDYGGIALADETPSPHRRARRGRARPCCAGASRRWPAAAPGVGAGHGALAPVPAGRTATAGPTTRRASSRSRRAVAAYRRAPTRPTCCTSTTGTPAAVLAALDRRHPDRAVAPQPRLPGRDRRAWLRRLGPARRHYEWWGGTNPLSGAIALADAVVAVSPNYAGEILTPAGGFGLDGPLRHRWDAVVGHPQRHRHRRCGTRPPTAPARRTSTAPTRHRRAAPRRRTAPRCCERARIRPTTTTAAGVVVTRLTDQKGIDLLAPIVPVLRPGPDARSSCSASGEAGARRRARARWPRDHPDSLRVRRGLRRARWPTCCSPAATCS